MKRVGLTERLRPFYPETFWAQRKLWAVAAEKVARDLPLEELDWILSEPVWCSQTPTVNYDEVPNETADEPRHRDRIAAADFDYPIVVLKKPIPGELSPRLVTLDGVHRLVKAKRAGMKTIAAAIIEEADLERCIPEAEDFESGFLNAYRALFMKQDAR